MQVQELTFDVRAFNEPQAKNSQDKLCYVPVFLDFKET